MRERMIKRVSKERHISVVSSASVLQVYKIDFLRFSGVVLQEEKKMEVSGFK